MKRILKISAIAVLVYITILSTRLIGWCFVKSTRLAGYSDDEILRENANMRRAVEGPNPRQALLDFMIKPLQKQGL